MNCFANSLRLTYQSLMKHYALLFLLSLVSCTPGKVDDRGPSSENLNLDCRADSSASIVNGTVVSMSENDAQTVVMLMVHRNDKVTSCTGVPISEKVILTAAHCVDTAAANDIAAIFYTDMDCASGYSQNNSVTAESYVLHPDFKRDFQSQGDLALIQLSQPIPANYKIASLLEGADKITHDEVVMLGYGITHEQAKDSLRLRKTTKSLKDHSYIKGPLIMFSQDDAKGGFCRGDSGGPAFVEVFGAKKIIGINSVNIGKDPNTECRTASASMYIPVFSDWIKTELNKF